MRNKRRHCNRASRVLRCWSTQSANFNIFVFVLYLDRYLIGRYIHLQHKYVQVPTCVRTRLMYSHMVGIYSQVYRHPSVFAAGSRQQAALDCANEVPSPTIYSLADSIYIAHTSSYRRVSDSRALFVVICDYEYKQVGTRTSARKNRTVCKRLPLPLPLNGAQLGSRYVT